MFSITKEFAFSASHTLSLLPDEHQCARLHGHNYIVKIELHSNDLDDVGFVTDYGDLSPLKKYIDEKFDHRDLNQVMKHPNPTAELIAKYFYDWCLQLFPNTAAIHVSETPKTWATYRP